MSTPEVACYGQGFRQLTCDIVLRAVLHVEVEGVHSGERFRLLRVLTAVIGLRRSLLDR